MTEKRIAGSGLPRRSFLKGGAGVVGATLLGSRLIGGSVAQAATGPRVAAPVVHPKKSLHLVGTDGWVSMPAGSRRPAVLPGLARAEPVQHLRVRVPRRDRDVVDAGCRPARQGTDQRADAGVRRGRRHHHHPDEPRTPPATGPLRRTHLALARVRQRDPALRRCPGAVALGASRPRLQLLLPSARRRDVHVPLPLRGRRARPDGHDRDGLRPAEAEQEPDQRRPGGLASTPTTTATVRRGTTASSPS